MSGMTHKKIYFNINKRITLFCVPLSLLSLSVCVCVSVNGLCETANYLDSHSQTDVTRIFEEVRPWSCCHVESRRKVGAKI